MVKFSQGSEQVSISKAIVGVTDRTLPFLNADFFQQKNCCKLEGNQ